MWTVVRNSAAEALVRFHMGCRIRISQMNELRRVVSWRQTNMDRMSSSGSSIIVFEPLAKGVGGDADDRIHLRIKIIRTTEGLHGNAVFLDLVDCSFKVLFANKG